MQSIEYGGAKLDTETIVIDDVDIRTPEPFLATPEAVKRPFYTNIPLVCLNAVRKLLSGLFLLIGVLYVGYCLLIGTLTLLQTILEFLVNHNFFWQ